MHKVYIYMCVLYSIVCIKCIYVCVCVCVCVCVIIDLRQEVKGTTEDEMLEWHH